MSSPDRRPASGTPERVTCRRRAVWTGETSRCAACNVEFPLRTAHYRLGVAPGAPGADGHRESTAGPGGTAEETEHLLCSRACVESFVDDAGLPSPL